LFGGVQLRELHELLKSCEPDFTRYFIEASLPGVGAIAVPFEPKRVPAFTLSILNLML
jgi:hypothetical protein